MPSNPDHPPASPSPTGGVRGRLRQLLRDEQATSDVEYILLTAMVVLPLFAVPPMLISANVYFFERVSFWVNLPFP